MPRFMKTYGKCKSRRIKSTAWLSPDVHTDDGNVFSSPDVDDSNLDEMPPQRNGNNKAAGGHGKTRRAKPSSFSAFFEHSDEDGKENQKPAADDSLGVFDTSKNKKPPKGDRQNVSLPKRKKAAPPAKKGKARKPKLSSTSASSDHSEVEHRGGLISGADDSLDSFSIPEDKKPPKGRQQASRVTRGSSNNRLQNTTSGSSGSERRFQRGSGTKRQLSRYPRKLRQDDGALCELTKRAPQSPSFSSSSGDGSSSWHPSGISSPESSPSLDSKSSNPPGELSSPKTGTPDPKRARKERFTRQRLRRGVAEGSTGRQVNKDTTSTPVSVYHSAHSSAISPVLFDASMEGVSCRGLGGHISEEEAEDQLVDSVFEDIAFISRNLSHMNFDDDTDPMLYKTCPGEAPPQKPAKSENDAPCRGRSLRSSKLRDLSISSEGGIGKQGTLAKNGEVEESLMENGGQCNGVNLTYVIRRGAKVEGNSSGEIGKSQSNNSTKVTGSDHSSEGGKMPVISEDSDVSKNGSSRLVVSGSSGGRDEQTGDRNSKTSTRSSASDHSCGESRKLTVSGDTSLGSSEVIFGSDLSSGENKQLSHSEDGQNVMNSRRNMGSDVCRSNGLIEEPDPVTETRNSMASKISDDNDAKRLTPCSVVVDRMSLSPFEKCTPPRTREMNRLILESHDSFKDSLTPTKSSQTGRIITARSKILRQCQQTGPISFSAALTEDQLSGCTKVGEGAYGEVFLTLNSQQESVALKIIPIEGDFPVNGEPQKTFEEILPEIVISRELSSMNDGQLNQTDNYIRVNQVACIQGSYPEELLQEWDAYQGSKGSENDRPDMFDENQLFILFEFANGGEDLEELELSSLEEAVSILQQVAGALAAAESRYSFEHRDLHWGNILIRGTEKTKASFRVDGELFEVPSRGLEVSIIDFTLSRLEKEGCTVFCDLANDATLFTGRGDYQFDIYRKIKKENRNNWEPYNPHSNVLWLHYVLEKLTKHKTYRTEPSREALRELKTFGRHLLSYKSAGDVLRESDLLQLLEESS